MPLLHAVLNSSTEELPPHLLSLFLCLLLGIRSKRCPSLLEETLPVWGGWEVAVLFKAEASLVKPGKSIHLLKNYTTWTTHWGINLLTPALNVFLASGNSVACTYFLENLPNHIIQLNNMAQSTEWFECDTKKLHNLQSTGTSVCHVCLTWT